MIEVLCYESSHTGVTKALNFIPLERSGENAANNEEQTFDGISILEHMDKLLFVVYTEISSHRCRKEEDLCWTGSILPVT